MNESIYEIYINPALESTSIDTGSCIVNSHDMGEAVNSVQNIQLGEANTVIISRLRELIPEYKELPETAIKEKLHTVLIPDSEWNAVILCDGKPYFAQKLSFTPIETGEPEDGEETVIQIAVETTLTLAELGVDKVPEDVAERAIVALEVEQNTYREQWTLVTSHIVLDKEKASVNIDKKEVKVFASEEGIGLGTHILIEQLNIVGDTFLSKMLGIELEKDIDGKRYMKASLQNTPWITFILDYGLPVACVKIMSSELTQNMLDVIPEKIPIEIIIMPIISPELEGISEELLTTLQDSFDKRQRMAKIKGKRTRAKVI